MVFGEYEYVIIDLNKLVVLPQVRKVKNSKIDEIADSIADRGLINPLDVARLNYDELKSHINFLNQLWKKNITIDSFTPVDDYYYVVIAGHSRLEALRKNAKINNRRDEVAIKIHKVNTSEEILAIQLDENIYMGPRLEERAIAIIETYRLGIMNGKWCDKSEFIKENQNKFSRRVLTDALVFADLPVEVQEYIFSNNIPFAVGVELGRIYPLIERYASDFNKVAESQELLEKEIRLHYAILVNKLQHKSIKKSLAVISGYAEILNNHFRPKDEVQQEMFDWWIDGISRQEEFHHKQLVGEYKKVSGLLNSMPYEYFMQLLSLNTNLTGLDHSVDIRNVQKLYHGFLNERLNDSQLCLKKR